MWRNYLTVGTRALAKNRTYAFINIVGLAIGMAACLMILLYVRYERSYDEWLPDAENIYQLQTTFTDPDTGQRDALQMSPFVAGKALKKDFPQVEGQVYALAASPIVLRGGEAIPTDRALFVDNLFFDVVALPLVNGDAKTALREPGSVVLSESEARKLFGGGEAVGRTLTLVTRSGSVDHRVTGVMRELPRNSHMRFTMIARFDPQSAYASDPQFLTNWGTMAGWNYVSLRPGSDPAVIRAALPQWEKRNIPDQQFGDRLVNQGDIGDWDIVRARDVHLGPAQGGAMTPGNDRQTIVTFSVIALLILTMACINFTNLATARASQRAREVALRKVLGATRRQLISQFIAESVLVAALAMLLSLTLVELLLPALGGFLDADLRMRYFGGDGMLLPILLLVLVVGAAGGVYPALYLSRFQPAQVLKANKSTAEPAGSGRLRSVLVVGQFAVSIALIICTAVVYGQTVYARTADPGFQRDGLLQIDIGRRQVASASEALAREIGRLDGVAAVGRTALGISTRTQSTNAARIPGRDDPINLGSYTIDDGFFRTMGMKLVAGRPLDRNRQIDVDSRSAQSGIEEDRALVARGVNVVINELAARRIGFARPSEAIGAHFGMTVADEKAGLVPMTVVGVVQDTRLRSIREPLEPIVFRLSEGAGFNALLVRYDTPDPNALRNRIEAVWKRLAPDAPFEAEFSEDIVAELYDSEQARAQTFAGFAVLAVIVACLGLFGLAAFTAERRTKEIGIRKVLGARTRDIVRLLAWQFSKPVIVANLIAWPVAWWLMRDWLDGFDSRIVLGPTPFLLAGLAALAIALGTIAGHAFKVARSKPIHALRYE